MRFRHPWLRRCDACGVLKADVDIAIPEGATESALDESARMAGLDAIRWHNNERLLTVFQHLLAPKAKLLDVGSGPGFMLAQASQAGYQIDGIEPDANTVNVARGSGSRVIQGYFPAALDAKALYDGIIFNDVLEHIPDLEGTLAACAAHLRPGGILCLNCPDKRGLFFCLAAALDRVGLHGPYDRLWQRGLPSPHVWYFTPALLARAAAKAGFQMVAARRLQTIRIKGLWQRIRAVPSTPLALSVLSYLSSLFLYPVLSILPSDSKACIFRLRSHPREVVSSPDRQS